MSAYTASRIKRRRATADEMEVRAAFLIGYATRHQPVTVRQLYYASARTSATTKRSSNKS
jgi:hypothetical protein